MNIISKFNIYNINMEDYKKEFIDFLLDKGALLINGVKLFELNSGRYSPYFINTGKFNDGKSINKIGYFYASEIEKSFDPKEYDKIFGPAYKGIPLCVATVISLSKDFGINKTYVFNRKEPKTYGDATKVDKQKNWIVGDKIEEGDKILLVDDVMTTGNTKYDAIKLLNGIADNLEYVGLIISVDRQEVDVHGNEAIKSFEENTGIPVKAITTISEIKDYLWDTKKISEIDKKELESYLAKYGTEEIKRRLV